MALALAAAGAKDLDISGADVERQCLEAGLIDEIIVFVAPVLLDDGIRLFTRLGAPPMELELVESGGADDQPALQGARPGLNAPSHVGAVAGPAGVGTAAEPPGVRPARAR